MVSIISSIPQQWTYSSNLIGSRSMHWKYNSGSPFNLPFFWAKASTSLEKVLLRSFFDPKWNRNCRTLRDWDWSEDFILCLIPVWSQDSLIFWKVFAAELMYLQENGHEQVNGDGVLAMLPVLWNWKDREKEMWGSASLLYCFPYGPLVTTTHDICFMYLDHCCFTKSWRAKTRNF